MSLIIHTLVAAKDRGRGRVAVAGSLAKVGVVIGPGSTQNMIRYPIECGEDWARDQASGLLDKSSFEYHIDLVTARAVAVRLSAFPALRPGGTIWRPEAISGTGPGSERARRPPGPAAEHGRRSPVLAEQPRTGGAGPGTRHQLANMAVFTGPLVGSFIARGTVSNLDTSCVAKAHGQPFALTLGATRKGIEFFGAVHRERRAQLPKIASPTPKCGPSFTGALFALRPSRSPRQF